MLTLSGYTSLEHIYLGNNVNVYRARRVHDQSDLPVVLKIVTNPTAEQLARLQREYALLQRLAPSEYIVKAYALEHIPPYWVMETEDFGGQSLNLLEVAGQLDMEAFISLAMSITQALLYIHENQVIHKDINPANVLYLAETGQVKLTDFDLASQLDRETVAYYTGMLQGTLAYIAPEQTGRMNRVVDMRSDLYSVGATFYELLTGQPPFVSTDPLELMHSHLARLPQPVVELRPKVPAMLSAIIDKLLAKEAQERYQSAAGLLADLETCRRYLKNREHIPTFTLGYRDIPNRLILPQTLYGREGSSSTIQDAFAAMVATGTQLLLVTGDAGVGKTALVQELYRPLTARSGHFLMGKFDQAQGSAPYAGFVQALQGLVRYLLSEPAPILAQWQEQFQAALGANAQVLIELVPQLEVILGEQPPVPELAPQEAQNRLFLVLRQFVSVFTTQEQPLLLFLDDLQWADVGSLNLLQELATRPEKQYLLLIGAYRASEVDAAHPLQQVLEGIRATGRTVATVALEPLNQADLVAYLQEALYCSSEDALPLARVVHQKTNGNPFFVGEFLKALYVDQLLRLDRGAQQWTWDVTAIEHRQVTENVVDLLTGQLAQLPPRTQHILQRAAFLGGELSPTVLTLVSDVPADQLEGDLEPAVREGYLIPLQTVEESIRYRFAHDRIQQAAYQLEASAERTALHWQIGQVLWQGLPAAEQEAYLFAIVRQLNQGLPAERDLDAATRYEVIQLNVTAGRKAVATAAFAAAAAYFQAAVALLPGDSWHTHYRLTLAVYEETAETAYLSGDFAMMEHLVTQTIQNAATLFDTIAVHETQIEAATAQSDFLRAISLASAVLHDLGYPLIEDPSADDIGRALQETRDVLSAYTLDELRALPAMEDTQARAALRILVSIYATSYIARPSLFPLVVTAMVRISVTLGSAPESAVAYAAYGLICCATGDTERGYRFGQLAVELADKTPARSSRGIPLHAFNSHIRFWQDHIASSIPNLVASYQRCLEIGNLEYAGYGLGNRPTFRYFAGNRLSDIAEETAKYVDELHAINQIVPARWCQLYLRVIHSLMHTTEDSWLLDSNTQEDVDGITSFLSSVHQLILAYLFSADTNELEQYVTATEQQLMNMPTFPTTAIVNFYGSLSRLRIYTATQSPLVLDQITANQKNLLLWSNASPENYLHKWHLVEAERCRILGEQEQAYGHYHKAMSEARRQAFIQEEALGCELLGDFLLAQGALDDAQFYMRQASSLYEKWGALAKTKHLRNRYQMLFLEAPETSTRRYSGPTTTTSGGNLDVAGLFKAIQAISGAVDFHSFLEQLMLILLENTGGERGVLLIRNGDDWHVQAESATNPSYIRVLQALPIEQVEIPHSVISYVQRTSDILIIQDVPQSEQYTTDTYFQTAKARSLLCLPLIYRGYQTGILYLENHLTGGAFTLSREMLLVLSGIVATALENAQLYTHMDTLVRERTQELETVQQEMARAQQQIIDTQQQVISELSTPLIPITDSVVTMPLIGAIDTQRAQQVMETLLEGVAQQRASIVIIDVTGVKVVDSQVANLLISAAQAVRLLGTQVILTGMRPDIAQTLVHLGIDLTSINTYSSLQVGISYALKNAKTGLRHTRNGYVSR